MSFIIKLLRGLKANLPASAPDGEPFLTTDTHELFVGTGTGMAQVSSAGSGNATSISGTPVMAQAPAAGQVLIFDAPSGSYVPGDPIVSGPDAPGTPPTRPPVQAGVFDGTNVQRLKGDAQGNAGVNVQNFPATQPVSAVALPLPAGAATEASLGTDGATPPAIPGTGIRGWLRSIYDALKATLIVSVSNFPATQPVSAAALPLPTGAATEASLGTDGAAPPAIPGTGIRGWLRSIYDALKATLIVSVSNFPATQPVSGTVTANAGTNLNTSALALETGGNLAAARVDLDAMATAIAAGVSQDNVKNWGGTAVQPAATSANDGTGANPIVRSTQRRFSQILTTTPLAANGVFNSAWFDTNQTGDVSVITTVRADQASAAGGFLIQEADDTTDANFIFNITASNVTGFATGVSVVANTTTPAFAQIRRRFWRVQYTNGATIQTTFKLAVTANPLLVGNAITSSGAAANLGGGGQIVAIGGLNQSSIPADNNAGPVGFANVSNWNFLYGPNGVANSWFYQRTPVVFKTIAAVAVTAGTPVSIWTPTSGKKFRVMGFMLSLSVAGSVILKDGTTEILRTCLMPAGNGQSSPASMGNGVLSALANNLLNADVTASGSVSGFVFGTEE
jgi:hypothetical protein